MADRDQLSHRPLRRVDRNRKTDPLGVAAVGANLRVDPDHAPAGVEEWSARVSVGDRRVDLDRVHDLVERRQRHDRAPYGRDDTDRDRVLVPERAAHRGDRIPGPDLGRVAERNRRECMSAGRHVQEGDVVVDVPADDVGLGTVSVLEPDEDPARLGRPRRVACVGDHVGARQDVATLRDDEPGALGPVRVGLVEEREDGDDAHRARGVDPGRVEAVAEQRAGAGGDGLVGTGAELARIPGQQDRGPGAVQEPRHLRREQRERTAEDGGDKRGEDERRASSHPPTLASLPLKDAVRAVVYSDNLLERRRGGARGCRQ